jgi:hypothetical protein
MKPDLKTMFPKGSKSFFDANAGDFIPIDEHKELETLKKLRLPKEPNKTEREFSFILEAQKRRGEIFRYDYEGITLRWFDMKYTPDFVVFIGSAVHSIKFIEVKGPHIWDRDIVRFKGARAYWPEFQFELWRKRQGKWDRIF